ncbi:MAG: SGNH/GDSL hydrolase family protein [Muribaculum sp.]|nr:SGNH/GDSL hydrolase family protein [Muribaculum sp.]
MNKFNRIFLWFISAIILFILADNLINWTLMKGINNYYGLNQPSEILLIGHSHLMLATDKERLEKETGMKVSKYCREGVSVTDKKAMVEHFLGSANIDSLKYVLYGVDLATFTGTGLSQNSYMLFYPFIDDQHIGQYIKSQANSTDYWLHKLIKTSRFNDDGIKNSAARGWLNNWDNLKTNTINVEAYRKRLANGDERHIQMNERLMDQFQQTVNMLTARGVKVILVNTPTLDLLNNFEPEKYEQIMQWFREYADSQPLVEFWDFNPQYQSDYTLFSDRLHLNQKGQQIITGELIKRINYLKQ